MIVQSSPQIVSDYCANHGTIRINRDYQRSGQIWPKRAKSALIETIILGFPMPALYLHQCYDKEARRPYKDLVDGQQRTECLMEFFNGQLRLSKTLRTEYLRNKTFTDLEAEHYEAFMSYSLPIFLFTQASEGEVREAFRRINSYNAVLNAHEIRHSTFQGEFKWFVHELTRELGELLLRLGVVSRPDMTRMKDTILVSEVCYLSLKGIQTTKQEHITKLYEEYDDDFSESTDLRRRVVDAFDAIATMEEAIINTALDRPYQIGMLALALMHARKRLAPLETIVAGGKGLRPKQEAMERLAKLAGALENAADQKQLGDPDEDESGDTDDGEALETAEAGDVKYERFRDFVQASSSKTNTGNHRTVRFRFFMDAVSK